VVIGFGVSLTKDVKRDWEKRKIENISREAEHRQQKGCGSIKNFVEFVLYAKNMDVT
jgi:hypothetical protein